VDALDDGRDLGRRRVDARRELVDPAGVVLVLAGAAERRGGGAVLDDRAEADVVAPICNDTVCTEAVSALNCGGFGPGVTFCAAVM
jgi:hypothetical protein